MDDDMKFNLDDLDADKIADFTKGIVAQTPECNSIEDLINFINMTIKALPFKEKKSLKMILRTLKQEIKELSLLEAKQIITDLQMIIGTLSIALIKRFVS